MADAPLTSSPVVVPPAPKKKHRFFRFLGWMFVIFLLTIGVAAALIFRLPQKLHITKSPAEKMFTMPPDREGAAELLQAASAAGMPTKGVELFVLPVKDTNDSVAYAVLDSSKGFTFSNFSNADAIAQVMTQLLGGTTAKNLGVTRVALDYRDKAGNTLITMTAPVEAIEAFTQRRMSAQEFMKKLDGNMNFPALAQRATDFLQ